MEDEVKLASGIYVREGAANDRPHLAVSHVPTYHVWCLWTQDRTVQNISASLGITPTMARRAIAFEAGRYWSESQRAQWNDKRRHNQEDVR